MRASPAGFRRDRRDEESNITEMGATKKDVLLTEIEGENYRRISSIAICEPSVVPLKHLTSEEGPNSVTRCCTTF